MVVHDKNSCCLLYEVKNISLEIVQRPIRAKVRVRTRNQAYNRQKVLANAGTSVITQMHHQ
jgi:hypothetical protein